jgi:ABC-type dipeptide/oligopeptide/nickel transport system permease component
MLSFLLRRLLYVIPVLLVTALLVFAALHLTPGDPVDVVAGPLANEATRDRIRERLGLGRPLPIQFFTYIGGVLQGDLGVSILNQRPVIDLIRQRLPITAELGVTAFGLTYLIALPLGVLAALHRNSILDWLSMSVALIGVAMPSFWLGLMLIYLFSVQLRLLPPTGSGGLRYLVLPALALALPRVGQVARITRSSMLEVIGQDYMRTAAAKGLSPSVMVRRHALRNALLPIVALMGLDLGYVVGGSVVIEAVFARPGIGDMMIRAITSRDFPVLQGGMFVLTLAIVLSNIVADVCYMLIDPRISQR